NVTIEGFKISRKSECERATFDKVVIESPSDSDKGIFDSPKITTRDGKLTGDSTDTLGDATLTDVTVLDPKLDTGGGLGSNILFHTAEATDLKVTHKDQPG